MTATFTTYYKNASIEILVEDDLITTSKTYIDGEMVDYCEISSENNKDGAPFKREHYDAVLANSKQKVDSLFNELVESIKI